ncbi:dihydrodipicolinate synthase family protein [Paramicrobacterium agarici]|uniref:dihydrodipicolinate synthase family protein n=1 Tax=Paramicrobacterium agarici TaxID=630514 RepID=UPI001152A0F5|nr:dihydrodipicolinate synthase family protein [Microbacterium agarici]TQO22297.1 4-hydroxy-tetrahydrodipicolinate synthase [Microbacterium agarici]
MHEAVRTELATVVGIPVTPFDNSGELDADRFRALIRRSVNGGVSALTPNGNTSEFQSLRSAERLRAVELTIAEAPDALVLPGVGGDLETVVAETRRYRDLGVRAVMVHQPAHPFWSGPGWIDMHCEIASAVPDIAVVPYIKSERVTPQILCEAVDRCPAIVAVKYAVPDVLGFSAAVDAVGSDRITWVCGLAEAWAPFFAVAGATGFTSGLVTVDPERSLRMLHALERADYPAAMAEWSAVREFEDLRAKEASAFNVSMVKQALAELDLCSAAVRAPLTEIDETDRNAVRRILGEWGLKPEGQA